ncbi:response regulator [bacterium]|nr:response regulator [candidate division CSSED10-310 bacterium]
MSNDEIKILVCEDDPDHRMLMMDALEENLPEATYLEAETGYECIELLQTEKPEVLILDYRLGDMDGIELLEKISDMTDQMAVLLVTSQGDEKIAVEAMKKGARDYLVKDTRMVFVDHLPISVKQTLSQIKAQKEKIEAQDKLKASEELNRTILDKMMEAVIFADESDRILHLNGLACEFLKTTYSEAIHRHLGDEKFSAFMPDIELHIQNLKNNPHQSVIEIEQNVDDLIFSLRLSPVLSSNGDYRGVILNLIDITQSRKEEMERLEAINRTVFALAKAVEFRDPYTAGHAANVAIIATHIAKMLGWEEKRIIGLQLACELHDIGKIAIPAEILTRPTKLSALEMEMLKEHPHKGYEILKDIKFPFPVAEAVYQHHEVMDGSGYPRGLKNDEIIPEAKIICVSDVLDAITSHRPYRPGLGIEKAIEQLQKGRGVLYDPSAVDSVLKLFKRSGNQPFWKKEKTDFEFHLRELRQQHELTRNL